jgi:hypothetical protein
VKVFAEDFSADPQHLPKWGAVRMRKHGGLTRNSRAGSMRPWMLPLFETEGVLIEKQRVNFAFFDRFLLERG